MTVQLVRRAGVRRPFAVIAATRGDAIKPPIVDVGVWFSLVCSGRRVAGSNFATFFTTSNAHGHVMGNKTLPYWRRVHDRALSDTLPAAVAAIAGAVALWYLVCTAVAKQSFVTTIVMACAILVIFPAVYLWKLITTPAKMDAEARKERDALRQELDGPHEEIRLVLGKLMAEGRTLMEAIERSSIAGKPLECMRWCEKVEAYLRELDEVLISRFRDGSSLTNDIPSGMFVANVPQYLRIKARVGQLARFHRGTGDAIFGKLVLVAGL